MFSSSYKKPGALRLLTSLVKAVDPDIVFELGTQQGASAVALGKGMKEEASLYTCDLFKEKYDGPPYLETHADSEKALTNLGEAGLKCYWEILTGDHTKLLEIAEMPDILHIDICNHHDNVKPVLEALADRVKKMIILEGGIFNKWQKEHGYCTYTGLLDYDYYNDWSWVTIPLGKEHYAMTIMTRRPKE